MSDQNQQQNSNSLDSDPSPESQQTTEQDPTTASFGPSTVQPDTFESFMQLGDASIPSTSAPRPTSTPPPGPSFLSNFFNKATSTIESTISSAQRDLSNFSNELLPQAQQSLSSVAHLLPDLSRPPPPSPSPPNPLSSLLSTPAPQKTVSLRTIQSSATALLALVLPPGVVIVATHLALWRFAWLGAKLAHSPFSITWSADGNVAVSTPLPPSGSSLARPHKLGRPVHALCAVRIPSTENILVGFDDGTLRVYAVGGERFGVMVRASPAEESRPLVMTQMEGRGRVAVGYSNGIVRVVDTGRLETEAVLRPGEMSVSALGSRGGYAPVVCVWEGEKGDKENGVWAGYVDGSIGWKEGDGGDGQGMWGFVGHAGRVSGGVSFGEGSLLVTIGDEIDPSLCAFETGGGRCLVRRMLSYVPSWIGRVGEDRTDGVGAGEFAFLVGGERGEVEIFRVVVLGVQKVELRLVKRVCEKMRGREKGVKEIRFMREAGILLALSNSGELRRWRLGTIESLALGFGRTESEKPFKFTERNVADLMADGVMNEEEVRLSSVEGITQAQNVLALILDEPKVTEVSKNHLIDEFQKKQIELMEKITKMDAELKRAGRRISARFRSGLKPLPKNSSETDKKLWRLARRSAAFEMEFASRRHAESQKAIHEDTTSKLKMVLQQSLRSVRREDLRAIESINHEIEKLGLQDRQTQTSR